MVGKEGALEGGGGEIIETFVMDGQKDNDVVSTAIYDMYVYHVWFGLFFPLCMIPLQSDSTRE